MINENAIETGSNKPTFLERHVFACYNIMYENLRGKK